MNRALQTADGNVLLNVNSGTTECFGDLKLDANVGFYGTTPVAKQTVTGSKTSGAALISLLAALVALGLITDSTSA